MRTYVRLYQGVRRDRRGGEADSRGHPRSLLAARASKDPASCDDRRMALTVEALTTMMRPLVTKLERALPTLIIEVARSPQHPSRSSNTSLRAPASNGSRTNSTPSGCVLMRCPHWNRAGC